MIQHFYDKIDVFVIPRLVDSKMAKLVSPLKPLEPMALGLPLIVSDSGAIRELVSDKTATIFESGSSDDLVEKILSVIDNEQMAIAKAENGKRWLLENATWEIAARKTIAQYRKIIQG